MSLRLCYRCVLVLLLIIGITSPALAASAAIRTAAIQTAMIQTTAPLVDRSDAAILAALETAVRAAITAAVAMGLPQVRLDRVVLLEQSLLVEVQAQEGQDGDVEDDDDEPASPAGTLTPDRTVL
jgi:hypothetical protein